MKQRILLFFILLIISLPTVVDLFKPGAYTSHDITHHIVRLVHMDRLVREGQIPPRWAGDLNMGYGYPLFLFNYPLPQYLGAVFHLLGANFVWSTKLVFIFSLVLSIFTGFIFFREMWGVEAGLVSAVYYLYAPIRFINVYVSATIGNALAFIFAPLPFYGVAALAKKPSRRAILLGAIGIAGLMLSHNIMALMFLPLFAVFSAIYFVKLRKVFFLKSLVLMVFFGLGISAFFWLPASVEKQYIRYDQILKGFYRQHFPTIRQLIYSPWGYGFSWPGDNNNNPGRMSNQVGLAQLFVISGSVLLVMRQALKGQRVSWQVAYFLIAFGIVLLLMLQVSEVLWERLFWMQYLQMPWRLLAVAIFCSAALAGYLAQYCRSRLLSYLLIILVIISNRNHLRINQVFNPGEEYFKSITGTTTMAGEHLPPWGRQRTSPSPAKVEIVQGQGQLKFTKAHSSDIGLTANLVSDSTLQVNQYFFPGWKVTVDGENHPFRFRNNNEVVDGLIRFELPPGVHTISIIFARTPVRWLADISTVSTFFLILVWFVHSNPKIRRFS